MFPCVPWPWLWPALGTCARLVAASAHCCSMRADRSAALTCAVCGQTVPVPRTLSLSRCVHGQLTPLDVRREILTTIGHKYNQYLDFRQQDAHEFLRHMLDAMRMEELDVSVISASRSRYRWPRMP